MEGYFKFHEFKIRKELLGVVIKIFKRLKHILSETKNGKDLFVLAIFISNVQSRIQVMKCLNGERPQNLWDIKPHNKL